MTKDRQLVRNAVLTPDGTILESTHRHDYKSHVDGLTDDVYAVDGGLDYVRRSSNKIPATPLDVYSDDPFEVVRLHLLWGTYGKSGGDKLKLVRLCDMTTEHIQAVIDGQRQIPAWRRELMEQELLHESRCTV